MSIFDGMAGTLNAVLGGLVTYTATGQPAQDIHSVFREEPVEVEDDDGREIVILAPTWRVPADKISGAKRGDIIDPKNGKTYQIESQIASGSPANDGFIIFELSLVE